MQNFLFSLNVTLPIFIIIVVGGFLKRIGLLNDGFCAVADKFVFKVALPVQLFQDIAAMDIRADFSGKFVVFCMIATTCMFAATWILGFGSSLKDNSEDAQRALLRKVEPHDLVKFGLIPELIGRLPVITVLDDLDEDALVRVLKEPRNSLVKQYKELLSMDSVELEFTDEALHAIARKTIERKTGARGLRSVMEGILLPVMYDVPNDPTIIRVTIDKDTVEGGEAHLEYGAVRKRYKNQTSLS